MLSRKKKILFSLILLLFPIAALLLPEIGLRCFWPQPPRGFSNRLFVSRDNLTHIYPDAHGRQYSREFDVTITGNPLSYRAHPGFDPELPPELIILGDSFAFGWGVEASEIVGAVIAAQTGWNVYSLGMPGDDIFSEKQRLQRLTATEEAPLVLLFFDNDLSDYARQTSGNVVPDKLDSLPPKQNPGNQRFGIRDLRRRLFNSHVVRLAGRVLDLCGLADIAAKAAGSANMRQQAIEEVMMIHQQDFFKSPAWVRLKAEYAEFIRMAKSRTKHLMIIRIVPPFFSELKRQDDKRYDYTICDDHLRNLCRNSNVEYFTFEPEDTAAYFFRHDMHLNPDGHRELARFILEKLGQRGKNGESGDSVKSNMKKYESASVI